MVFWALAQMVNFVVQFWDLLSNSFQVTDSSVKASLRFSYEFSEADISPITLVNLSLSKERGLLFVQRRLCDLGWMLNFSTFTVGYQPNCLNIWVSKNVRCFNLVWNDRRCSSHHRQWASRHAACLLCQDLMLLSGCTLVFLRENTQRRG